MTQSQPTVPPSGQLPFAFDHRPARAREDFIVAPCNAAAVALIDAWPGWAVPAQAIWGPPACGKTHLAAVFAARSGAATVALSAVTGDAPDALVVENGALIVERPATDDPLDEEALFHLLNLVRERRASLLILADEAPARWPVALPDLASRLGAVPATAISAPDDILLEAMLAKLFADRQIRITPAVLAYLLSRIERSHAAAARVVARLDTAAMAQGRAVTVPLARAVLAEEEGEGGGGE